MFCLLFVQAATFPVDGLFRAGDSRPISCRFGQGSTLVQLRYFRRIPIVWCWPSEQIALNFGAAFFAYAIELRLRLDTFGYGGHAEALSEIGNRLDHSRAFHPIDSLFHE